ncbi:MAG: SDR family oxidoreductase [Deltaproteobacteria bacterium]|jgi:NAD(P)-dependent dehydrogenase (short-subunit alcohol dehydrogenase family)
MLLENTVAVVTGMGPGMGQAIAKALAREGADLVLASRSEANIDDAVAAVEALGRRALGVATDISDGQACKSLVEKARQAFGRVDVLVNNAYHPGVYRKIEDADLEDWRPPFEVNVLGTMKLSQAVIPAMKDQGGGSIVMINSMSMRTMVESFGGYAASKAALLVATQTLALELGPYNIRVNSVVPGYIWGPNLKSYFEAQARELKTTAEAIYDGVAARTALKHIPTSEEIAESVVFFASDRSKVITGQSLDVNGGHFFC